MNDPIHSSSETASSESPSSGSVPDLAQFIPMLTALQSVQRWLPAAPTFVPQTFQEQIQFVFDGTNYSIYFYANNQWNGLIVETSDSGSYGDGSDGPLVFDGSSTVLGMVPSGGTYTMTRDIFATTMAVNLSATVKPNGFKIYASTSITITGTISVKGGAGGSGNAGHTQVGPGSGAGGPGGSGGSGTPTGTIKQPGNGAAGTVGMAGETVITPNSKNGTNGSNESNCCLPNNAASGGNSASGTINPSTGGTDNSSTGGTGGTATRTTGPHTIDLVMVMFNNFGSVGINPTSGSGAGGGGGAGINGGGDATGGGGGGGGAGAPGGCMWLASPSITVTSSGSLDASGGIGGVGGTGGGASGHSGPSSGDYGGGSGGGGGGGNGGLILLITPSYANSGTVTVAGALGGAGGSGASSGGTGSNGLVQQISP